MKTRSARLHWLPDALPPLRGAAWWIFLSVWSVVLGLVLYGGAMDVSQMTAQPQGFGLYGFMMQDSEYPIVRFTIGEESARDGVQTGDRLVAINEKFVQNTDAAAAALARTGRPAALTFDMVSRDGRRARHRLTRSLLHYEQALRGSALTIKLYKAAYNTLRFIFFPLFVALALLLIVRRARDPLAPWLSLTMLLLELTRGEAYYWSETATNWLGWVLAVTYSLGSWLAIVVLALFPEGRFAPRWIWLFLIATLPLAWFVRLQTDNDGATVVFLIGLFVAIGLVLARYRVMAPGTARQQVRWMLIGFAGTIISGALALIIELVIAPSTRTLATFLWSDLSNCVVVVMMFMLMYVTMTVGLLRFRLYDAEATISRSIGYGALTLVLIGVFAGSEQVIEVVGEQYFGRSIGPLAGGFAAAVAAVMITPLHNRITHWAVRHFRTALTHLRRGLPLLVGDMRETATLHALTDAMLTRVEKGVRAKHGAVVIHNEVLGSRDVGAEVVAAWLAQRGEPVPDHHKLDCVRADPLFPMRVPLYAEGVGLIGWLLLGPRPDGSFYGREEREALIEIADPIARAIAIVIERERRLAERREQDAAQKNEIEALRHLVESLHRFIRERFGFDSELASREPGSKSSAA